MIPFILQVGIIIASDETVGSIVAISNRSNFNNISDGFWHSVVVRKSGSHVQFLIDEHLTAETNTAPQLIRTDSDLFIGGVPSQSHDIVTMCIMTLHV